MHRFQVIVWLHDQVKKDSRKKIKDKCNEFSTILWTEKNHENEMNDRTQQFNKRHDKN